MAVALAMGWSQSKVSRIESGAVAINRVDLDRVWDLYDRTEPPSKIPRHLVGCSDELWHAALARAKRRGESMSDVVARALAAYLAEPLVQAYVAEPGVQVYYCPTAGEIEQHPGGGFDVCCDAPERHVPVGPR